MILDIYSIYIQDYICESADCHGNGLCNMLCDGNCDTAKATGLAVSRERLRSPYQNLQDPVLIDDASSSVMLQKIYLYLHMGHIYG